MKQKLLLKNCPKINDLDGLCYLSNEWLNNNNNNNEQKF